MVMEIRFAGDEPVHSGVQLDGVAVRGAVRVISEAVEIFGTMGLSVKETDQAEGSARGVVLDVQMTCGSAKLSKATLDAAFGDGLRQKGYRIIDSALSGAPLAVQWESVTDGWEAYIRTGPDRLNGMQVGQKYAAGTPTPADNVTLPQTAQIYTLRVKPVDGEMSAAKIAALGPALLPIQGEINRALRPAANLWTIADTVATVQRIEESNFGLWAGLGFAGALAAFALSRKKTVAPGRR